MWYWFHFLFFSKYLISKNFLRVWRQIESLTQVNIEDKYISIDSWSGAFCIYNYILDKQVDNIEPIINEIFIGEVEPLIRIKNKKVFILTFKNCDGYRLKYYRKVED